MNNLPSIILAVAWAGLSALSAGLYAWHFRPTNLAIAVFAALIVAVILSAGRKKP